MINIEVLPFTGLFDDAEFIAKLKEIGLSVNEAKDLAEMILIESGHGCEITSPTFDNAKLLVNALRSSGFEVEWEHG